MKKIFFILSVLFIGLLVGCASKPTQVKEEIFNTCVDNNTNQNLSKKDKIKLNIIDAVHQPFLTKEDVENVCINLAQSYRQYDGESWFSDNTATNNFIIRISNSKEEELNLRLISKFFSEYTDASNEAKEELKNYEALITEGHERSYHTRCFDITIPAKTSKEIVIPGYYNENVFHIYDMNKKAIIFLIDVGWPSIYEGRKVSQMALNEIYRTHSLEITYDKNDVTYRFIPTITPTNNVESAKRKWFD